MIFKKAFLSRPRHFIFNEVEESPAEKQVLVKIASCGLCNWELNFWEGNLNFLGYPHPLGHEWSGIVVELGVDVKTLAVGDKVSCFVHSLGGFSEYKVIDENYCQKLNNDIDPKYSLGEPQKCVVTVLRSVEPQFGDNAVIVGCGPMGLWCVQGLSGNMLNALIAIDIIDSKLEAAKKFGATHVINAKQENVAERIREITNGQMADFVIEGTGIPTILNQSQNYLKTTGRGRLALMSSHSSISPEFDFRVTTERAIQIIAPHPNYSLNEQDDFRRAVAMTNKGTFKVKELISHEFKLAEIQKAFEVLENKPADFIKGIVVP